MESPVSVSRMGAGNISIITVAQVLKLIYSTARFSRFGIFMETLFGSPTDIGAASWLHALYWISALIIAAIAGFSIRNQAAQSRADLLLNLYQRWESQEENRQEFLSILHPIRNSVIQKHRNVKEAEQQRQLRLSLKKELVKIQKSDKEKFNKCIQYLGFFEVVGAYTVQGYIPLKDAVMLYKGPIIDLELAFSEFIGEWQNQAHMPSGLLINARYLMFTTKWHVSHPILHRVFYKPHQFYFRALRVF